MYLMTSTDHPSMASSPHFFTVSQSPNWADNLYLGIPYSTTGHACQKTSPKNTSGYPMLNHRPHTTRTPGRLPTDVLQLLGSTDPLPRVIHSSVTVYKMQPCLAPVHTSCGSHGPSPSRILSDFDSVSHPHLGNYHLLKQSYDCQMTR